MAIRFKKLVANPVDPDIFMKAAEAVLNKAESDMAHRFGGSVEDWDHKPKFITRRYIGPRIARVAVGTNDKIYGYVNNGTKPHIIKPKKKKQLSFQKGYKRKSVFGPGRLRSRPGGPHGEWVHRRSVKHPGTDAVKFDEEVARQVQPLFTRHCLEEFAQAAREAQK